MICDAKVQQKLHIYKYFAHECTKLKTACMKLVHTRRFIQAVSYQYSVFRNQISEIRGQTMKLMFL